VIDPRIAQGVLKLAAFISTTGDPLADASGKILTKCGAAEMRAAASAFAQYYGAVIHAAVSVAGRTLCERTGDDIRGRVMALRSKRPALGRGRRPDGTDSSSISGVDRGLHRLEDSLRPIFHAEELCEGYIALSNPSYAFAGKRLARAAAAPGLVDRAR